MKEKNNAILFKGINIIFSIISLFSAKMGNKTILLRIGILTTLSIIVLSYLGYLDEIFMAMPGEVITKHTPVTYKGNNVLNFSNGFIPEAPTAQANEIPEDQNKITVVYNYILENKGKILLGIGVLILVAGGYYIFQDIPTDADDGILFDAYGITGEDYYIISFDEIKNFSDAEFDAWFEAWLANNE
jgi:hypothetical protein